jgi:hypothetical protein
MEKYQSELVILLSQYINFFFLRLNVAYEIRMGNERIMSGKNTTP